MAAPKPTPGTIGPPTNPPDIDLIDGRVVSTWSPGWLEETRRRGLECNKILAMSDRDERRLHIAQYEMRVRQHLSNILPAEQAAERAALARTRLEAAIMHLWRMRQGIIEN